MIPTATFQNLMESLPWREKETNSILMAMVQEQDVQQSYISVIVRHVWPYSLCKHFIVPFLTARAEKNHLRMKDMPWHYMSWWPLGLSRWAIGNDHCFHTSGEEQCCRSWAHKERSWGTRRVLEKHGEQKSLAEMSSTVLRCATMHTINFRVQLGTCF